MAGGQPCVLRLVPTGLTLEAAGNRHARAWIAPDHVGVQSCHFPGCSAVSCITTVDLGELRLERQQHRWRRGFPSDLNRACFPRSHPRITPRMPAHG